MLPKAGRRFFYAVARGRETGVFATWDQCSKVVNGFAGAKYKKFDDRGAAEAFARGDGGATTSAPTRKKQQPKRTAFAPPAGVLAVYTDGGCRGNVAVDTNRTQPAGWGFVAVRDGHVLAERWGPVELARGAAGYLGAEKCSNNTGELSAIGEALLWLRDEDRGAARALICYDSKYAANITDGTYRAHKNVDLARTCQSLFAAERSRRAGGVALQHVKGHSGDAFNDRADALVQRGIAGDRSGRGADAPELKVRMAAACALTKLLATLTPLQAPGAAGPPPPADAAELAKAQRALFDVVEAKLFADEHVDVLLATLRELAVAVPLLEGDSAARVAALVESTVHDNWRVRAALNGALPAVALARGKDAFEAQLLEGFVRSFQDRISEVRTSAVAVLGELRALKKPDGATGLPTDEALFDGDWLMEKIGKRLSELYLTMSYYLYRITIVAAFERLAHADVAAEHMETIVLFLVDGARDDVPNVRFTAVKALETVSLHANDRLVANFIKPVLNELLANDTDADVRNYVKGAIAAL